MSDGVLIELDERRRGRNVPQQVTFDRRELDAILRVYGFKVGDGEWRDYAIDFLRDRAVFSIYARASEAPLFRVVKEPKLARPSGRLQRRRAAGSGAQARAGPGAGAARVRQAVEAGRVSAFAASVLTLYPDMFPGPLGQALAGRALERGDWTLRTHDIRDHAHDRHASVDDTPAGGGAGMVLRADVLARAIDAHAIADAPRLLMSPRGRPFTQALAREWATGPGLTIVCGRFEGVDERVIEARGLMEVSVGDYVLSGGEPAAQIVLDACVRLLPGVMGNAASGTHESFEEGCLEHPHYTRPHRMGGPHHPGRPALRRPRAHRRLATRRGRTCHARAAARSDDRDRVVSETEWRAPDEVVEWDEARALELVGTTAIVTLRFVDTEGDDIGTDTFTGLVIAADEEAGIELEVFQPTPGETVVLAPILDAFRPADPGFYELVDEALTMDDPDWLVDLMVTIDEPGKQLDASMMN